MTPAIQLLLIQIMELGAMLAANPRYTVFVSTSGHVGTIEVLIYPAGASWAGPGGHPKAIAVARACWQKVTPLESDTSLQRELAFMRAALHAYLPSYPAEPEPPATAQPDAPPPLQTVMLDESLEAVQVLALHGGITELLLETGPLAHTALLTVDKIDDPHGYGLEATLEVHKQRHSLALRPADGIYMQRLCEWIEAIALNRLASAA